MNNHETIKNLEPVRVWELFAELSNIPRPSRHEEKVRIWLRAFAQQHNLRYQEDEIGNLVIYKSAQHCKSSKTIIMQAHMDMVCQKADGIEFDFYNESIKLIQDNERIYATNTTLGSDNGVGLAMILAILEDMQISHPNIQALFTMNEEDGMDGANNLDVSLIGGDYMLNLDSEMESIIWTSSAGSRDIQANLKLEQVDTPQDFQSYELVVTGLRGGHSGINIQDNRVNAIKLIGNIVDEFQNHIDLYISSISGGNAKNAIPRYCELNFSVSNTSKELFDKFQNIVDIYSKNYFLTEPDLKISLRLTDQSDKVFDLPSTNKIIKLLNSIHSGVYQMSADMPILVQTSANLGTINTQNENIELLFMVRSNDTLELKIATNQIIRQFELVTDVNLKLDISNLGELKAEQGNLAIKLPKSLFAWKHDPNNPLIPILIDSHKSIFGFAPKIEAVHAGLECGVLKSYLPDCNIISFGPTIENAHSPAESVNIKSVKSCYELLKLVITKLAQEN